MKKAELNQHKKSLLAKKDDLERSIGQVVPREKTTDGHGDFADRSAAANEDNQPSRMPTHQTW